MASISSRLLPLRVDPQTGEVAINPKTGKPFAQKKRFDVRYRDSSGKERTKTFKLNAEAVQFKNETEGRLSRGTYIAPEKQRVTLRELLEQAAREATRSNTAALKRSAASNLGTLGDTPIGKITRQDVREWLGFLQNGRPWAGGKPLAASSASMHLRSVKACLNQAVSDRLLERSPADGVRPPKAPRTEVTHDKLLTEGQLVAIADKASPTVRRMIRLQYSTGLRPGEVCGLRRRSVDPDRGQLLVREQSGRGADWAWYPLKTDASVRDVPLGQMARDMIREQLAERPDGDPDEPLFITRQGGMFTSNTYGGAFLDARVAAGISHGTPHDCRHFFASLLISEGLRVTDVQVYLGHQSAKETLSTYAHLWPKSAERTLAAIDNVLTL
ncbi:site-specific integrase [Williamsia herbipolensis]|uniref:Site-specific integrase n=1 Tax=Williamsia herbipolensis TaxID=1603258 RepID=A0AAU4K1U7_9NOCA|nr:tyrosine-type recombinase/integrase [Williamsia herbipolensis]